MKILLSAYACEPNSGSEPFLGWRWATEISKHHDVWVITRKNNSDSIDEYIRINGNPYNIKFVYIELPKKLTFWKKGRRGIKLFYTMWQRKAIKVALKLNKIEEFDIVHHITFGAYTQPTYMYKLKIPFVWGPLGGGEKLPKIEGRKIELSSMIYETVRNLQIKVTNYMPYARNSMKKANIIIVTTEETKRCFPTKYHHKIIIFQSLGIDKLFMNGKVEKKSNNKVKILMVGRMIGWKGFDIGIKVFKKLIKRYDNIELHLRGNGNLKEILKQSCGDLLNKKIFFSENYLEYGEMYGYYSKHDIFLNTSLHDSGCLALLEAMSAGLPVVCIDAGGPKVLTDNSHAFKVLPGNYKEMNFKLEESLSELIESKELRIKMGEKSKQKVLNHFMYEQKYKIFEEMYRNIYS